MFEQIKKAVSDLKQAVDGLDPEVLEPQFAAALVKVFSEGERVCSAGKSLAARRVEASGAWRITGERTAAHWMAKTTGEPVKEADNLLRAAKALEDLAETEKAFRSGRLSQAQAKQIADAAWAAPKFEKQLLQAAETESFAQLKQRCDKVKASSVSDEAARHNAIYRARRIRHWTDGLGAFRLDASLTPEAGGILLAALQPLREKIFAEAKKRGSKDSYEACGADALVQMARHFGACRQDPKNCSPRAMVQVRVDHSALVRGHTVAGETCEIAGVGPVAVATVRKLASDAFLAAILTDGTDVKAISHMGRLIPARLRTAIEHRDQSCVVPGCQNTRWLEIDHVTPIMEGGPTCLENLARLCSFHHDQKTYRGYKLLGGPGRWRWRPPEKPDPRPPA